MIDVKKAKSLVEKKYSDREVKAIGIYGNGYLVTAPEKNSNGGDYDDPYFKIDGKSGSISSFSPIIDFEGYSKAFSQNLVYKS